MASVMLTGMSFAARDATATAALALGECGTSSWASATSVACTGAVGDGGSGGAVVSVGRAVGTSSAVFSYDCARRSALYLGVPFPCKAFFQHCTG